jgi:hypothetical protein
MEKLEKKEGVVYTQNKELPIEERIFFVEGVVADKADYRIATEQELIEKEEYERKMMEEFMPEDL